MRQKLIDFLIKNPDISIRKMEQDLGIPTETIRPKGRGIPDKHVEFVHNYLVQHYGFIPDAVDIINNEDNKDAPVQTIKIYNIDRIPGFKDNIPRYQCKQGLWRRVILATDGKPEENDKANKKWEPASDEVLNDKIGSYYVANNKKHIYITFN